MFYIFLNPLFKRRTKKMTTKPSVLFILKYRENSYDLDQATTKVLSSGLCNSATYVCNMLTAQGYTSNLVHVIDNNSIDAEVTKYKPDIVIIEAYWVVPSKFEILTKLHPTVKWIIRNHSNAPFLANEGIAYEWTLEYMSYPNVWASSNHYLAQQEFVNLLKVVFDTKGGTAYQKVVYLPNYYPLPSEVTYDPTYSGRSTIDIGCFGAIRPLKNQMIQAIAAIEWSRQNGKFLRFHINGGRIEGNGDPILKNIRALFTRIQNAQLVEHNWLPRDEFLSLVSTMDLGMQVSFSETFNIVAADFVSKGVPIVVSKEIDWVDPRFQADPNSVDDIIATMTPALAFRTWFPEDKTVVLLNNYNQSTIKSWVQGLAQV
jgi:hypothetical protein